MQREVGIIIQEKASSRLKTGENVSVYLIKSARRMIRIRQLIKKNINVVINKMFSE